ncbi:MAG: helix-turn-helix domain-containing protein [Candidatus Berkelbacteria bacterium]|nr:helix-turn-helix domain-containing protein [Candidatus Berkelbacteria bacterium]
MEMSQIGKRVTRQLLNSIPNYHVYGDKTENDEPDFVHVERIQISGKLHKWHMKPHQHRHYFQIIFYSSGSSVFEIDGSKEQAIGPVAITIPPACIHGFHFQPNTDGYTLTIAESFLFEKVDTQNKNLLKLLLARAHVVRLHDNPDGLGEIEFILKMFDKEFNSPRLGRVLMLQLLFHTLMLLIRRQLIESDEKRFSDNTNTYNYNRYRTLVEEHFREHWQVTEYSNRLGLAERHLNRICRIIENKSALEVINGRLLLEAKRKLIYTTVPIASLAFELGFHDPAYFSRFFKKNTGLTPGKYRFNHNKSDISPYRTG